LQPTARGIENCDAPIASPDLDLFALGKLGCVLKSSLIVLAVDVRSALEVPVTPYKVHFIVGHFHHPEKRQARLKRKRFRWGRQGLVCSLSDSWKENLPCPATAGRATPAPKPTGPAEA
jgi:hypothetical protein